MSIMTWQERLAVITDTSYQGYASPEEIDACKQAESNELRAEIKRLRGELADQVMGDGHTIAEQRKVLEQALESLKDTLYFLERHSNRWDGVNGNHPMIVAENANAAITAIQEQLK